MGRSNLKLGKRDATIRGLELLGYRQIATRSMRFVSLQHPDNPNLDEVYRIGRSGALRTLRGSLTNSNLHTRLQELGRWPNELTIDEARTVWRNLGIAYQQQGVTNKL